MLLFDVNALNNPGAHDSHWAWALALPITFVYFPGGHLVWAVHFGWEMVLTWIYLPNGHVIFWAMVQESNAMLLPDVYALKNPVGHTLHSGWVVAEPIVFVYLPAGHLGWAMHRSINNSTRIGEM